MSEVVGKRVDGYGETFGELSEMPAIPKPGAFWWQGDPPTRMSFVCPCGCGSIGGVGVGPAQAPAVWEWNGDMDKPTVRPSILFLSGCKWHGFLTDGVFRSC